MKIVPISNARQNIFNIVEQVITNSEPIEITAKKGNVIVISEEDWNSIQETLYLLSHGMAESIIEGMNTPLEECTEDIGWDIN